MNKIPTALFHDADSHSQITHNLVEEQANASKTSLGFWIYLMTDCVLFASLFATFVVLRGNIFGGPSGSDLFSLPYVLIETILLLTSSFICGLALLAARAGNRRGLYISLTVTFLLGAAFLGMEMHEFAGLVQEGHSWNRSGFLSAFFTLVGTHGAHISVGLIWIVITVWQIYKRGIDHTAVKRLQLFSMFWHFLDIVWIFIFTIVYLLGVV